MQIGVLGGTGPAGSGLATRLASAGFDVVIGSRSKERADETVHELTEKWEGRHLQLTAADNAGAAAADVVVVATPWDAAVPTVKALADELEGKVVISMVNAISRIAGEFLPLIPPRGSMAASVQAAIPRSQVAAALHHVPAKELGDLHHPCHADVLVCSDHAAATAATMEILNKLDGMRTIDAGKLSHSAAIEAFCSVLLQVNVKYKTRVGVQFTGLEAHFGTEGDTED